jgi:hypothetical protein
MYYSDLSPYHYITQRGSSVSEDAAPALNIGWLDSAHPFPQAKPSPEFVARLWAFCRTPINTMLGFHECPFCDDDPRMYLTIEQNGEKVGFGHAEIWIFGREGKTYAAPTLISHYVVRHHYNPPAEFNQAVLEAPLPDTPEYDARAGQFEWGKRMLRQKKFLRSRGS